MSHAFDPITTEYEAWMNEQRERFAAEEAEESDSEQTSRVEPPLEPEEIEEAEIRRLRNQCGLCGHDLGMPWVGADKVRCNGCGADNAVGPVSPADLAVRARPLTDSIGRGMR